MAAPRSAPDQPQRQADEPLDAARRRLSALLLGAPAVTALGGGGAKAALAAAAGAAPADGHPSAGRWVHAFAAYGLPKYGPDFTHFDYVEPRAPVGGTIKLRNPDRRSSFDKYNPWTTRGNAPAGVMIWMVEGLCHLSQDEPQTMYGLLAESIYVEPDFSAVSFRLRPEARFNDGSPVLAADVKHSYDMLASKGASPAVQTAVAGIARVLTPDARTVRFEFKQPTRDEVFTAATMPVFSRKWGEGKSFDQIVTELPITTGPYLIDKIDMPRRIEFRRNPAYWGNALAVRRGHFNFERVVYRNYQDGDVAFEAFKAGEFDLLKEYSSRSFVRKHKGVKWDDGRIVKAALPTGFGQQIQCYNLNLRLPKFQDIRVREALGYTYDFDTINKTGAFTRASSVFNNSEFAAQGLPGAGELKLLEPFRAELPPRVFGPAFKPPTTANNPKALRENLLKARALLAEAGCTLGNNGKLRLPSGEPLEIEYMVPRSTNIVDWQRNLDKLGVTLKERLVDFALYRSRLEQYDFDMVVIVEGTFTLPSAATQAALYGSKSADEKGNSNFRGVKSPAIDHIIEAMSRAQTLQDLRDAARAMDRVVMWSFWQIPDLWASREPISYWNKFAMPQVMPPYFAADTLISGFTDHAPWPLWTWWDKSLPLTAPLNKA
jgi:peptide/nickel transport system substrate-binding protein/microcin C transport system substrate-binding protein